MQRYSSASSNAGNSLGGPTIRDNSRVDSSFQSANYPVNSRRQSQIAAYKLKCEKELLNSRLGPPGNLTVSVSSSSLSTSFLPLRLHLWWRVRDQETSFWCQVRQLILCLCLVFFMHGVSTMIKKVEDRKEKGIEPEFSPDVKVNPDMIMELEKAGLAFVGKDETGKRMVVSLFYEYLLKSIIAVEGGST